MKYDTKEEIEKTGAWLLRISEEGHGEELMYVPSELYKLGVAPIDVADNLDTLRKRKAAKEAELKAIAAEVKAMVAEVPVQAGTVEEAPQLVAQEEPEPEPEQAPEPDLLVDEIPMTGTVVEPLVLNYDQYGLWEWMEPIERMVEEAMMAVFIEEPDLPEFNQLASASRLLLPEPPVEHCPKRRRGKTFRSTLAVNLPQQRADELVSSSVGASE